jgi:hypothetical protein
VLHPEWLANPVLVLKKNKVDWRMCVDYTNLNKHCPKDPVGVSTPGGSLDRRVNCRRVPQPRWVGARRSTKGGKETGKRGNPRPSCCPAPRSGTLAVGGYKRPRGRERGTYASARSPARPTFSYESPGPSFYRRKERAQVYNGRCSSVLTCLAERS